MLHHRQSRIGAVGLRQGSARSMGLDPQRGLGLFDFLVNFT
jgi:hypothetical protein